VIDENLEFMATQSDRETIMAVKARDKWRADEAEINKKEIYKE
jgi:hypothetical protein